MEFRHAEHGRKGALRGGAYPHCPACRAVPWERSARTLRTCRSPIRTALPAHQRRVPPQPVHFFLVSQFAIERYGRRELVVWTAVQGHEFPAVEDELDGHDRPRPPPAIPPGSGLFSRSWSSLKIGHVEVRRLFGLAIEPKARSDALHGGFLLKQEKKDEDDATKKGSSGFRC